MALFAILRILRILETALMEHFCPTCNQPLPAAPGKRRCTGPCGLVKPLEAFYRLAHGKHGRRSRCKECMSVDATARRQAKPARKRVKAPSAASQVTDAQIAGFIASGQLAPATGRLCAYCKAPAASYHKLRIKPTLQLAPVCAVCAVKIANGVRINPYVNPEDL